MHAQTSHHQIVIVGGGSGGLTVAARLKRALPRPDIAIMEPSRTHYYQPLWTLVGAGIVNKEVTARPEADYIPQGVHWIQDHAAELHPAEHTVITRSGMAVSYDYLVVAPGIQLDWDKIPGLPAALGTHGVCSNYAYEQADKTWETLQRFQGGNAVFTMPSTPIKCGGAPQKIMYLADEHFRRRGVREKAHIIGAFASKAIFGIPMFARAIERILERKEIDFRPHHDLIALSPEDKMAVFRVTHGETSQEVTLPYDMIHVTPPQSAPDCIKSSPLAHAEGPFQGWLKVDPYTLQNSDYPEVFGLGDATGIPNAKTGAAVRKQAPVVVANLCAMMQQQPLSARYNGYGSCPLVTGYGKVMMIEFDYDGKPVPTFPLDPTQERYSMYLLKRYALPFMYWHGMLRGRA
jgi:sulfide:quinone oxidoreductase